MTKKIVWEKWIDPFLNNIDEVDVSADFDDGYDDDYDKKREPKKNYSGPVMVGPMGIIPLNEHNSPSKVYCFWMMHTNFDITAEVQQLIAETAGVEALDIFTRYRARLAVGKAFLDQDKDPFGKNVLIDIEAKLCPKKIKQVDNLLVLKSHLQKKYKHWAIFTLPDGTLEPKGAATMDELREEANLRGATATSWE